MSPRRPRVELPGTAPLPLRGSRPREEAPDPEQRITVTVVVRSRAGDDELAEELDALAKRLPHERRILSHEEHEQRFGSTEENLAAVQAFAAEHGLQVVEVSAARRVVELSGTLAQLSRAFGVRFHLFDSPRRPFRTHDGPVAIPRELEGVVEDVIGLDDRPLMRPLAAVGAGGAVEPGKLAYVDPRTLAAYYRFPTGVTGAGQHIAVLQFGGGYHPSDLETYFRLRGLSMPELELVELPGQTNQPADQQTILSCAAYFGILDASQAGSADPSACTASAASAFWATIECTMDLQLLGTLAPGARLTTYLAPDTPSGHYAAFSKAIFDPAAPASVINCSWGSCENKSPQSYMISVDKLFQQAALKGVTICASAGDFGDGASTCGEPTGHFPATSPYALACGGTSVSADLSRETSWYEFLPGKPTEPLSGGGGYSQFFAVPSWQKDAGIGSGFRGFPDIAAKADIVGGYDVVVAGVNLPMGGTSAAAPTWAALVALLNERLGQPGGLLGPHLYSKPFVGAVRDITQSGGGPGGPTPGWDPCTGLGSPVGTGLLAALTPDPEDPKDPGSK